MNMAVDWLAAGVSPVRQRCLFSPGIPERAELHLLLSMICPLSWLLACHLQRAAGNSCTVKTSAFGFLGCCCLRPPIFFYTALAWCRWATINSTHIEFAVMWRSASTIYTNQALKKKKAEGCDHQAMGKKTAKLCNNLRKT
jgi:tryptophanyl-tRNA synthetase